MRESGLRSIRASQEHAALIHKRADRRVTRPRTVEHAVHVRRIDAAFAQPVDEPKRNVEETDHERQ